MNERSSNPERPALPGTESNGRLEWLEQRFLDLAREEGPTHPETLEYIQRGDSLRLCLNEILTLRQPAEAEVRLDDLRQSYVDSLFKKATLLTPGRRAEYDRLSDELQAEYVDMVIAKIAAVIDAQTSQDALRLGVMPHLLKDASFVEGRDISAEDLAGNHLYLLIDTALKEHIKRRRLIEAHRTRSRTARLLGSRALRLSIASGVIGATLAPKLGVIPQGEQFLDPDIQDGLRILSAVTIGITLPEVIRLSYLDRMHNKRSRELHDQLAATQELCDLSLRMVYGSSRTGGSHAVETVTGRAGTGDVAENIRILQQLDNDFPHLNNDPGGKPYNADQALGYAARLLIERQGKLFKLMDSTLTAPERRQAYIDLCQEILTQDVRRMKKGLNVTKIRRAAMFGLSIIPALVLPSPAATASDALSTGEGAAGILTPPKEPYDE